MFKWFKSKSAIYNTIAFSTEVMSLFEKYQITDQNTRNAILDTLIAVISQHKTQPTVQQ